MRHASLALACLLLAGCGPRGPLDGLSEKELRAAKAHADMVCSLAKKTDVSTPALAVALGDMAVGFDSGNPVRIAESANHMIRQRGCAPR